MGKEIRVQLYKGENDDYNELWKDMDSDKIYARHTWHNLGTWYFVCDPDGYCELDHQCPDDYLFIICDSKGNECFRYSNKDKNPLPKLETVIKSQWDKTKKTVEHYDENYNANFWAMWWNGETTLKLDQWLLSFCDSELYPEIKEDCCIELNWVGCWHNTETEWTPILGSEFEYLGQEYYFVKVHHKHDTCGAEWDTFECCAKPYEMGWWSTETHPQIASIMEMGNWFDSSKTGTMYAAREAKDLVMKKLLEVYPFETNYQELFVVKPKDKSDKWSCDTVQKVNYMKAAEMLVNGDYHRAKITELIDRLKVKTRKTVFIDNHNNRCKIKALYPDIYAYDNCLL